MGDDNEEKPKQLKLPKVLPLFLTTKSFRAYIVDWSDDTIYRRINEENMPAEKDGKSWIFPTQDVLDWFKRRLKKTG